MKKITMLLIALFISAALFADVSGSVSSTSAYDPDAETLAETVATTVNVGALALTNTFYLQNLLLEPEFDWCGIISYAVNDAITVGISTGYGVTSDFDGTLSPEVVPLGISGSWQMLDALSVSFSYTNDNLNPPEGEETEIGSFSLTATFTF